MITLTGDQLLGLPLPQAISILEGQGISPKILRTKAPRDEYGGGEERVLCYREGSETLVVAAFRMGAPKEPTRGTT